MFVLLKKKRTIMVLVCLFCLSVSAFFVATAGVFAATDNTVYYNGNQSVKIVHDSLAGGAKYLLGEYSVDGNAIHDISAYFCSANATAQTDFRIDAEIYDESGNKISDIAGRYYRLNSGTGISNWVKTVNRPMIPENAVSIKLYAYITQGRATVYVDGISVYDAEENGEIIVEKDDFTAFDQNGKTGEWTLAKSGDASVTKTSAGYSFATNAGIASLEKKIVSLQSDVSYTVSTEYTSTAPFGVKISFYDFYGNNIENYQKSEVLESSAESVFSLFTFVAPSHVYAVLSYESAASTTVTLKQMIIKETGDGNMLRHAYSWNMHGVGEITTEDSVSGYAIKMDVSVGSSQPYVGCVSAVRLHPGREYKFSYYVKAVNVQGLNFRAFLDLTNSDDSWINDAGGMLRGNCEWTYKEEIFSVSKTCYLKEFGFQFLAGGGTVYIDCVKISSVDSVSLFDPVKISAINSASFEAAAGENVSFPMTLNLQEETKTGFIPRAKIYKDGKLITTVTLVLSMRVKDLVAGENSVIASFKVPDFLTKGGYSMIFSPEQVKGGGVIANFTVTEDNVSEQVTSEITIINGAPTITINGEPYSAILYQKPFGTGFLQDGDESIYNSGIKLYITYKGGLGVSEAVKNKGGIGMNDDMWKEDGSLDFTAFDAEINATVAADSEAMIMVNINMFAPSWWIKAHPDDESVTSAVNGTLSKTGDASFASETFIAEAGEKLQSIILHMSEQTYYNRVFGIKLSAGRTFEWMSYGENGVYSDYSVAARNGFRKYLKEKYIDVTALRSAWGDSSVTFDTAAVPSMSERGVSSLGMLVTDQRVVDFNNYVGYASAKAFLSYAKIVKENLANDLIVGGYNGYLWFSNGHDGLTTAHTSLKRVLESEYVDFIASPANYGEKTLGRSNAVMSVADTVRAYGKLYIIEEDNRTSYAEGYADVAWSASSIDSIGKTYTSEDTLNLAKRDSVYNFINGNGEWLFDMEGGWFDDEQFYSLVKEIKKEKDRSLGIDKNLNNEVALFVPDTLYSYAAADNGSSNPYYLYNYLYRMQRKNLDAAGAGYDVYALSSIEKNIPDYKVNIMLSPVTLSEGERNAVNAKLKKDGKYIIWIYLADFIGTDGSTSVSRMSSTIGINVKTDTVSGKRFAIKFTGNNSLINGLADTCYGSSGTVKTTLPYVSDSSATTLGFLADYTSLLSRRTGLAYKDNGSYKTVYSAVPNLPEGFLRNVYAAAGVKIYSQNPNDIVWTNSSYVAIHSAFEEEKTINLNGKYAVYDVFAGKYISRNASSITYRHEKNDTKLFRLTKAVDYVKYTSISLDGTIGVNFYVEAVNSYETLSARMWADGEEEKTVNGVYDEEKKLWKFSYGVAAKDYKKKIYIRVAGVPVGEDEMPVVTIGGTTASASESVESYAAKISAEDRAYDVVSKMLDYCEAARVYFAGESASPNESDITFALSKYKPEHTGADEELKVIGFSLVLESSTAIKVYFSGNITSKTFTVNGNVASPELIEGSVSEYYIEVKNVAAKDLDNIYVFVIGGHELKIGALSYAYVVNAEEYAGAAYKNVIKALYAYNVAANNYFR